MMIISLVTSTTVPLQSIPNSLRQKFICYKQVDVLGEQYTMKSKFLNISLSRFGVFSTYLNWQQQDILNL